MVTGRPARPTPPARRRRVAGQRNRATGPAGSNGTEPAELPSGVDGTEPAELPSPFPRRTGEGDAEKADAGDADTGDEETAGGSAAGREPKPTGGRPRRIGRAAVRVGRLPGWVLPAVSIVLIVVFGGAAALLGHRLYQGHERAVARTEVLHDVPSYASTILSFDYRKLDQDAAKARPLLTGTYRSDYDASMHKNAAAYRKYHYVVHSTVASAGVADSTPDRVRVVAFIDQTVTAGTKKSGTNKEQIRLALTFERHGGTWLVSKVAPI